MKPSRPHISTLVGLAFVIVVLVSVAFAMSRQSPSGDNTSGSDLVSIASTGPSQTLASQESFSGSIPPCCSPPVAPSVTPYDARLLEESDRFWDRWRVPIHMYLPHDATSMVDNVRNADLVVRGRIQDLYIGEYWRGDRGEEPYPLAYIRIGIDEVLKGEPASRTPGVVEVQLGVAAEDLEQIRARLPDHDNLWFLKGPVGYEGRDLRPQSESEIAPFAYVMTNAYQGVLREINGNVEAVGSEELVEMLGADHFPMLLDGTRFDVMMAAARATAAPLPDPLPSAVP